LFEEKDAVVITQLCGVGATDARDCPSQSQVQGGENVK
jgi:hypothetical protein